MQQTSVLTMETIQQYEEMGFTRLMIEQAHQLAKSKKLDLFDILVNLSYIIIIQTNISKQQREEPVKQTHKPEPKLDPKVRRPGQPTVLKSTRDVKFFNSFLQVFFHIPKFVEYVFAHDFQIANIGQYPRLGASLNLMKELQELFCLMIFSKRKDVDAQRISTSIVDDLGNRVASNHKLEEQIFYFLSRVEEALRSKSPNQQQPTALISSSILSSPRSSEQKSDEPTSCIMLSSGKKKSSSILMMNDQNSSLLDIFIGQLIVLKADCEIHVEVEENCFHMISLSREFTDVYEAWQHKFHLDEKAQNETEIWIKRAPKVIVFEIQELSMANNFKIDNYLYIDRFLLKNKQHLLRNRAKLYRLKEKKAELEELLKNYENYGQTNTSIPSLLEMTIKLLQTQGQLGEEENPTVDIILETIIETNQQITKLQEEIQLTTNQIDDLFTDLKEYKYDLSAIITIQGDTDTGNECVYIRNRLNREEWIKFEETIIERRRFEQVHTELADNKNNFYLIFVDSNFDCSENNEYAPFYSHFDPSVTSSSQHDANLLGISQPPVIKGYHLLVGDGMKRIAIDYNKQFEQELNNLIYQKQAEDAVHNYSNRINYIQNTLNQWKNQQSQAPPLHNFAIFLKNQSHDAMSDDIFKWQVFDCAIRDVSDKKLNLQEIRNVPSFAQKSSHLFLNMNPYKAPTTINVSTMDMQKLNFKLSEYVAHLQQARVIIYSMQCLLEEKLQKGLNSLKYTLELNMNNYFHNLALELFRVTLLKLAGLIFNLHAQQQFGQLWDYCQLIMAYSQYIQLDDIIQSQLIKMLSEFMKKCSKKALNSDQQKILKNFIKSVQDNSVKELKAVNIILKQDQVHKIKTKSQQLDQIILDQTINQDVYHWQISQPNDVNIEVGNQLTLINAFCQADVKFKKDLLKLRVIIEYEDRLRRGYHKPL